MTVKVGKQLFKLERRYSKAANGTLDLFFKDLAREIADINREIADFYNTMLLGFAVDKKTGRIKPTLFNSGRISVSKNRAEKMARDFIERINEKLNSGRRSFLGESSQRDRELKRLLKKAGIKLDRTSAGEQAKKLLQDLTEDAEGAVRSSFQKWSLYYPSILRRAVTTNQKPETVKALLIQPNGHIRIGSSLNEQVMRDAAMDLLQQRTAQTLVEARELKLDSCWNANPMDQLTKPECAQASTAGVIPIPDMESNYGMPPRYICRCDIMIVSSKWTNLNKGVNRSIEQRRTEVIAELQDSPAKLSGWKVSGYTKADGTKVKGYTSAVDADKYPVRAAGHEHYQDTQDKLLVWADNPVPEYE